jgi:hypothetical protein
MEVGSISEFVRQQFGAVCSLLPFITHAAIGPCASRHAAPSFEEALRPSSTAQTVKRIYGGRRNNRTSLQRGTNLWISIHWRPSPGLVANVDFYSVEMLHPRLQECGICFTK